MRRVLTVAGLTCLIVVLGAGAASAHPLGNVSVNRYSGLQVGPSSLRVDFAEDLAEIPTVQVTPRIDRNGDGRLAAAEVQAYAPAACRSAAVGMRVVVGGSTVRLSVDPDSNATSARLRPGAAGLPTLLLRCDLVGRYPTLTAGSRLIYQDTLAGHRQGWSEVTAVGDRTTLRRSDVPASSPSRRLSSYPTDLLSSPLDVRGATMLVDPGGRPSGAIIGGAAGSGLVPRVTDRLSAVFTGLVGHRLSIEWVLTALLIAFGLGAAHAVAPGHGKTMMAGYLLGRRDGGRRAALTVAGTVTVTHTAGVLLLGLLATATTAVAPRSVFPLLGTASGLLVAVVGAVLLRGQVRRRHAHDHAHDHDHDHGGHSHPHPHRPPAAPGRTGLIGMGIAGGLVPSPSALVVLLGATALGRAAYGVALVVAFGVGLASTLTLVGLLAARAGDRLAAVGQRHRLRWPSRVLPLAGAATVFTVGLALTARGLAASLAVL